MRQIKQTNYFLSSLRLCFTLASLCLLNQAQAASWTKLNENAQSKLLLDKQSVIEKDQLKKAWLKIEYKTPQKNLQDPEKSFNLSKVLWYFDCPAQKSATSQVAQYLNGEMVFSAGIDAKNAEFIEPVPETDVDIAMRYVCAANNTASANKNNNITDAKTAAVKPATEVKNAAAPATANNETPNKEPADKKTAAVEKKVELKTAIKATTTAKTLTPYGSTKKADWAYEGETGPDNWGKLNPEFATCSAGRNQSPINIDETIKASLKKIRGIQKFPAKDIVNNGHTVQVNFKEGNMLVLDNAPYQMKLVNFHAPSENTIHGKYFPLEAQFLHADSKGNLTVIGVMFKEGKSNQGLEKLWEQIPEQLNSPVTLKNRIIASELMPENRDYYRFSGSLTTPPCSEGVRWIMLKTPMTGSKEQIEQLTKAIKQQNNRPIQALNGRVVLE